MASATFAEPSEDPREAVKALFRAISILNRCKKYVWVKTPDSKSSKQSEKSENQIQSLFLPPLVH